MKQRIIKFRAWDSYSREMLSGMDAEKYVCGWENDDTGSHIVLRNNDRYRVMQFTGLLDRNGKEIYEGDIVKWHEPWSGFYDEDELIIKKWIGKISFERGCFWFHGNGRAECNWHLHSDNEFEVIGNIYEHSYLLTKEQQDGSEKG